MKVLSIGDIHGLTVWKDIIKNILDYDLIIFIGDYCDQAIRQRVKGKWQWIQTITNEQILYNLQDIIKLKVKYPDKVILLWGNHDIQYYLPGNNCSGKRPLMEWSLKSLFEKYATQFQYAYQYENHIWTHAGVNKYHYNQFIRHEIAHEDTNIADTYNRLGSIEHTAITTVGRSRGGINSSGGILWCDKLELEYFALPGYTQIVGHTATKTYEKFVHKEGFYTLHFIDHLPTQPKGLVLNL